MRRGNRFFAVIVGVAVLAVLTACYFIMQYFVNSSLQDEPRGDHTQRELLGAESIRIQGRDYYLRNSLTTILLMGIDMDSGTVSIGSRNGGQADFLRLLVIDSHSKTLTQIAIDRDTITPITILGVLGDVSGKRSTQICLAHGFGDGGQQSCELTVQAVSELFLGIPIDYYIAVNMDAVPILNDAVGGITVTLEDDFSQLDPAMRKGDTIQLTGEQARYYTRYRINIGEGTNASRMLRQETYIGLLLKKLSDYASRGGLSYEKLYDALDAYMVTNYSRGRQINTAQALNDYLIVPLISIEGEHAIGSDGFVEFHADQDSIKDIVIDVFTTCE